MEELENKEKDREEIFSRAVRAGKRTYFFDVKATVGDEFYLTITESKRRFNNDQGKFFYEKHKLFLYREDFEKFVNGMSDAMEFIRTGKAPVREDPGVNEDMGLDIHLASGKHDDFSFEDLHSGEDEK